MKATVLICARQASSVILRAAQILYWQEVTPAVFHFDTLEGDAVRIRLEAECDQEQWKRLTAQWEAVVGVQSVPVTPLGMVGADHMSHLRGLR